MEGTKINQKHKEQFPGSKKAEKLSGNLLCLLISAQPQLSTQD